MTEMNSRKLAINWYGVLGVGILLASATVAIALIRWIWRLA